MQKQHYPHKVTAVYPNAAAAVEAVHALEAASPGDIRVSRVAPDSADVDLLVEPEPAQSRNALVRDAAGTAVSAGAAALPLPTLFLSAPVVGPLIVLGYGTVIGGTLGAMRGLRLRESLLAVMVNDALKAGYHVVIVQAADAAAEQRVRDVIGTTLSEETAHT